MPARTERRDRGCRALWLSAAPLHFRGICPAHVGRAQTGLEPEFALGIAGIWYESPQRVHALLADVDAVDPGARVFLLREYTKRFEEQLAGTAASVAQQLAQEVRGEIALAILPSAAPEPQPIASQDLDASIDEALRSGESVSAIAKALSERGLGERRHLYALASQRKRASKDSAAPER